MFLEQQKPLEERTTQGLFFLGQLSEKEIQLAVLLTFSYNLKMGRNYFIKKSILILRFQICRRTGTTDKCRGKDISQKNNTGMNGLIELLDKGAQGGNVFQKNEIIRTYSAIRNPRVYIIDFI